METLLICILITIVYALVVSALRSMPQPQIISGHLKAPAPGSGLGCLATIIGVLLVLLALGVIRI
jgi:hypothetical protein